MLLTIGSWPLGVDCERICGREDETFSKSALRRPSALLSQRIEIHVSGDDRYVQRILLNLLVVPILRPVPRFDGDSDGRECQPVHTLESCRNGCDYTSVEID